MLAMSPRMASFKRREWREGVPHSLVCKSMNVDIASADGVFWPMLYETVSRSHTAYNFFNQSATFRA